MDVYHNVSYALQNRKMRKEEIDKRVHEIIETVGLEEHIYKKPKQLSGGQQQRVAIARALANKPSLLLADEPTAALDSHMGRKVMELLKNVAHTHNTAVLVVTHDHRAIDVFDRIWMMEDGKLSEKKPAGLNI